jgi:hypothetical protein
MTVQLEEVAAYVGISVDEPALPALMDAAAVLVEEDLKPDGMSKCPAVIFDMAVTQTVDQLWRKRNAPGGVAAFGEDGQPVFLPADVLKPVRPLYARYRPLGSVG